MEVIKTAEVSRESTYTSKLGVQEEGVYIKNSTVITRQGKVNNVNGDLFNSKDESQVGNFNYDLVSGSKTLQTYGDVDLLAAVVAVGEFIELVKLQEEEPTV